MTTATKVLAALNLLGAVISIALLVATFFAQGLIIREARDFALDKTRAYLEPAIPTAEKVLKNPLVAKALPKSVEEKVEGEIADYRESPEKWLLELAEGTRNRAGEFDFPEIKNPLARKALDALTQRVAGARDHFKRSFANLILDLRIFATIHVVVFGVAAALCFFAKNPSLRFWLCVWSCVLLLTTVLSAGLYLGQNWLWVILTNRYQGWAYAGTHFAITVYFASRVMPEIWFERRNEQAATPP
ncbi:MAG: hypothetical protein V4819_02935 [Verrucomicrobiota bacterium]